MRSRRTPADLRTALWQQTRAVAEAVAQLMDLGAQYRRAASGPGGEPNRANEALLALERAKEVLHRAIDCYEHPEPLEVGVGRGRRPSAAIWGWPRRICSTC
jgi:hypothetical protein